MAAETAASMTLEHPDYGKLAGRLVVDSLHKQTKEIFSGMCIHYLLSYKNRQLINIVFFCFADVISDLFMNEVDGNQSPIIAERYYDIVTNNAVRLNAAIDHTRDRGYDFFGIKTLQRSYLLKKNGIIVERPQHMLMRVAVGIHGSDIDAAIETYDLMSKKYFTHASPTLFQAATTRPQLSSCYLLAMKEDSIEGIYETVARCGTVSKFAGGIGLHIHAIRGKGSRIAGSNSTSNGIVPMLRVLNSAARHVNQGGDKRPGSFAVYIEPWHSDVFEFLNMRKNTGHEEERARDLFYGLWIPDLFMRRVEEDGDWCLMCPNKSPGLFDCWGEEFDQLYTSYERSGCFMRKIKARDLWTQIITSQVETGTPYLLYKDACNRKSNQQNLGTIKCSNLCTEIVEFTSPEEIAVCNLASIALNMFVTADVTYDFATLKEVTKTITKNLNKIIDINCYPLPQAERSNKRHRPIGIGVQGLADTFMKMRYAYESPEARMLNLQIFETIYYGALEASCELATELGPYETYPGCPVSKGILQYDMWNKTPTALWDWAALKEKIALHGVRNSLLVAPMPTATTAQILGNNESFEPYTSNVYTRRVLSGEFQVVNRFMVEDLLHLGLWDEDMRNEIMADYGSIQSITRIPREIRDLYKTVWEISVRTTIDMAVDRGAFIDQSQSFNIHVAEPTYGKMSSIHFYGWKSGLKTGMYYLRTRPAANPIQFTVDKQRLALSRAKNPKGSNGEGPKQNDAASTNNSNGGNENHVSSADLEKAVLMCSLQNKDECMMCGS